MRFQELIAESGAQVDAVSGEADVFGMSADTRTLKRGELFVCMPSPSRDTHAFLPEAAQIGAAAVLTHSDAGFEWATSLYLPAVLVTEESPHPSADRSVANEPEKGSHRFQEALWRLAKAAFGNPSSSMRVVGVTGTNGKTTTAWLIRDAMIALGRPAAYLGTLGFQTPLEDRELSNTTPFSVELNALLAEAAGSGSKDFVMEVSSHALQERRCDGVEFDVGVFTNLTQDHLDFHGSMEAYKDAKRRLFAELPSQSEKPFRAALNLDDPVGTAWAQELDLMDPVTFGLRSGELRGEAREVKVDGLRLSLRWRGQEGELRSRLGGSYNVENCLSAAGGLLALGHSLEEAIVGLERARPVPGRFEAVPNERGIGILVDYAHTPDALEKLLAAVRPLASGKVIVVFGCGGDRDRTKRPLMARAVSAKADLSVVTSDNPRTEDPFAIVAEVEAGIIAGAASKTIVDRREAVAYAIGEAQPGDVVVIAGKGHENYQIIGRTKHPMDDRALARDALKAGVSP